MAHRYGISSVVSDDFGRVMGVDICDPLGR
jgi:hypothetical protein